LAEAGRDFWSEVTATYALRPDELRLLGEACRTLDDLAALRAELAASGGMVTTGSTGQPRAHPLIAEVRAHRLVLVRVLDQLALPDDEGVPGATPAARRAARAANERWRKEAVAYGEED